MHRTFFIDYNKAADACSICWETDNYKINELEPYIYAIQCDDGEDFHELLNAEWPDADGRDDFRTIEIQNFEPLDGGEDNVYLLCFTAVVSINLEDHPVFRKALEKADNNVYARIQFKKNGKPILDDDGYEEFLFEPHHDNSVDLQATNI